MTRNSVDKIKSIQSHLKKNKLDALLITDPFNIRYLSNFTGTNGQIFITPARCFLLTDFRYLAVAKKILPPNIQLKELKRGFFEELKSLCSRIKTLGFEEKHLTYLRYRSLKKNLPKVKLKKTQNIVESLRKIKSAEEIKLIEKAQQIAEKVLLEVKRKLKTGKTEIAVAMEIEEFGRKNGADGMSFPPIVGFGKNSASPHHQNTNRRLKKGDIVLVDMGVIYNGYCSDMTRMIFTKKPTAFEQKIYTLVLKTQEETIKKLRAGIKGSVADKWSRDIIAKAGYGKFFGHSLGHGIGLEVHESPYLSTNYNQPLPENTIITVEPGIYLRNHFGVRIEDMVLIRGKDALNLTKVPKLLEECVATL